VVVSAADIPGENVVYLIRRFMRRRVRTAQKSYGASQNNRLATYLIPTALDAPRIRTILVGNPYSRGLGGMRKHSSTTARRGAVRDMHAWYAAHGPRLATANRSPERR